MYIKETYDAVQDAHKDLANVIAATYPVGSSVYWMHGNQQQKGEVLFTASEDRGWVVDRLRVRNYKTGNTVDVAPCHLCDVR